MCSLRSVQGFSCVNAAAPTTLRFCRSHSRVCSRGLNSLLSVSLCPRAARMSLKRSASSMSLDYRPLKRQKSLPATQAAAVRSIARRVVKQDKERKHYYIHRIGDSITDAGQTWNLSGISEGDGMGQRDGQKILPVSLTLRMKLAPGDSSNHIRIAIVRWKENDGLSGCSIARLVQDDATYGMGTVNAPLVPWTVDNQDGNRFTVLYDRHFQMNTTDANFETLTIKLGPRKFGAIHYSDGTTAQTGGLYLVTISDSSLTPHPVFNWTLDLEYIEK